MRCVLQPWGWLGPVCEPGSRPQRLRSAELCCLEVMCWTLALANPILTKPCFLSRSSLLLLVDFQIIRPVSEADSVFSPGGRTPVLWDLITRRGWPSTGPSKAQSLSSPPPPPHPPLPPVQPPLARTSGAQPSELAAVACQGLVGVFDPVLRWSDSDLHRFPPLCPLELVRGGMGSCRVTSS